VGVATRLMIWHTFKQILYKMTNIFVGAYPNLRIIFGKNPLLMDKCISDYSSVVLAPLTAWRPKKLPN